MVDPRVVEEPREDEKKEKLAENSQVYMYSLPLWQNMFNEGKEGSHKGTR